MTIAQPGSDALSPITTLRVTDAQGSFDISIPPGADTIADLPRQIDLASVTLEIVAIDERFTQNRRFNEPTMLPAALSEIQFDGESPQVAPVERLTSECRDDLLVLDDGPIALSFDTLTADALAGDPIDATSCTESIDLAGGTHRLLSTSGGLAGFDVDRVALSTSRQSDGDTTGSAAVNPSQPIVVESSSRSQTLEVPPCPNGCWVIHGEGYNDAWEATADGRDMGPPRLIDGNANGWWLNPTDASTRVEVRWPVQRQLNIAFLLTALAVLGCIALIAWRRRTADATEAAADSVASAVSPSGTNTWALAGASIVASAILIDWVWAIPVAVVWTAALLLRRRWFIAWAGVAIITASALIVTYIVRSDSPFPDAGWPVRFEWLHPWTLVGVALLVSGSLAGPDRPPDDAT